MTVLASVMVSKTSHILITILHKQCLLGPQATEGAHQSHSGVQKQAAATPAGLWFIEDGPFYTGPSAHALKDAWPDDDGPATWHDASRWHASQDAPGAAVHGRRPTPEPWSSRAQAAGSPRRSCRLFPTGAWNAGRRPAAPPRKTTSTSDADG